MSEEQKPVGDEPKPVKKKKKRQLSVKAQRMVKALTKANSVAEAGRMAGINTRVGAHKTMLVIKRNAPEILEELGYGQKKALSDLVDMTQAKETKFFADKGIVIDTKTVAAQDIRLRARIELNKMHEHYPQGKQPPAPMTVNVQNNTLDFAGAKEGELDEFLRMCARFRRGLSGGTGVEVPVEPHNVAPGQ